MNRISYHVSSVLALTIGVAVGAPARAASLQPVNNWGASGVPSYISMYIYVPDKLATNPPILVVSHFCGGSASAVFGQAQGGGIVSAADTYGFIMIFPQTTNPATSADCWDVGFNCVAHTRWWRRHPSDCPDGEIHRHHVQCERRSCLCDRRLVRRHDDASPARRLSRCLQGRVIIRGGCSWVLVGWLERLEQLGQHLRKW